MKLERWTLTLCLGLACLLMVIGVFAGLGFSEDSVRVSVRATARVSAVLFLLAFSTSSLARLVRSSATRWLLVNRRYVGVSFAVSHALHLGTLGLLASTFSESFQSSTAAPTFIGGGVAYAFIAAMALTSSDRAQRRLGSHWRQLHRTGGYVIWGIFAIDYVPSLLYGNLHSLFAVLVLAALGLRVAAARRSTARVGVQST